MKLDSKVKENALIGHCFNTGEMTKYIGEECYFTDDLEDFSNLTNLTNTLKGVLKAVAPEDWECYLAGGKINGTPGEFYYAFCLPAEFVEEKKLRPYTLMEFDEKFTIGRPIKFRRNGMEGYERYLILNGYKPEQRDGQTFTYIYIGQDGYTLDELFNCYEWQEHYTEDFKPFGVEE